MKIDSEHLEILAMIVARGGLTEGAEALAKSQPSVSRTMSLLEKRVGAALFEPGRRPLRPTELGRALAAIGARIHDLTQEASALVDRVQSGHAGHLRMGGTPLFMDGVIVPLLAELQDRVHGLQFEQVYGYYDSLAAKLRNRSIDLAVVPLHASQCPVDMDFVPILPGRNVIACRQGHPLTRRGPITLSQIEEYSWVSPPTNSPLARDLTRAIASIGGSDKIRFTFSGGTLASITSFLARSDCLTLLPYSVVYMTGDTFRIATLPIKIDHPDRQLGILILKEAERPAAVDTVIDHIRRRCDAMEARIAREQQLSKRRA